MMKFAIECSTKRGSVAVAQDDQILYASAFEIPRGRGGTLFPLVQKMVSTHGLPRQIRVGVGPGSYNGLRVAIACAQGLALAGKKSVALLPVISSLTVACGESTYFFVGDARGGAIHFTKVCNGGIDDGPRLILREVWDAERDGYGETVYSAGEVEQTKEAYPSAERMVLLSESLCKSSVQSVDHPFSLEPIYLKPPHITVSTRHPSDISNLNREKHENRKKFLG